MAYLTYATLKTAADKQRIHELTQELKFFGCQVRFFPLEQRLYVQVPAREERWIQIGGLRMLMSRYDDVAAWIPRFFERPESYLMQALPMGGEAVA